MSVRVRDLDFVFLSYDEPNADANWRHLQELVPQAKRVHGVKGMNSAFAAAGRLAETERFVTVDADCLVDPQFLDHAIADAKLNTNKVISWPSRNLLNGLAYGNGGLKCWTRSMLAACTQPDSEHVDHPDIFGFLFEPRAFASCSPDASPMHAFRSGFREGARIGLVKGRAPGLERLCESVPANNLKRLERWCTIGAHRMFGRFAIWGARKGCLLAQSGELASALLADFDHFNNYFSTRIEPLADDIEAQLAICAGPLIEAGLTIAEIDAQSSAFFLENLGGELDVVVFDMLGNHYRRSKDIKPDPIAAFEAYRTGSFLGNSNAMNNLARCHRDGEGTNRDRIQAQNWVLNAAACNNRFALARLSEQCRREGDEAMADYWAERAKGGDKFGRL